VLDQQAALQRMRKLRANGASLAAPGYDRQTAADLTAQPPFSARSSKGAV
jgi:hypothetical protein